MKKTLLCFLLLFTTTFYSQVAFVTVCANETFNLTSLKADFIGNLNPAETTVTYFLSENDALNNTNVILNPTSYTGITGTSKIYGRIDNNGTITTNYFNLTTFPALTVTASNKPILCKGETASLSINVSGGSGSYLYSLNGSSFTNQDYYSYLPAGIYTITVRDDVRGCKTSIVYTITEPSALVATQMIVDQNTIIVTANGGTPPYQYSLNGINFQSSNVFSNVAPGNYNVSVSDSEGCSATVNTTVAPFLNLTAFVTKDLDCSGNGNNGIITANATGGQAPYTYSINGFTYQTSNIFNNLNAGTYSITVKDALNSVSNPFALTIAPLVNVTGVALVTDATSCNTASIKVQATSGQAPFYYSMDNGQTFTNSNVFSNLAPGNYTFLIKDSKNCVSTPLFNTVQPPSPPLMANVAATPILCWGEKATLTIAATGGQAPYQYSINNDIYSSNNVFANLNAGNYIIKVKDAAGCITTLPYTITQPTEVFGELLIEGNTISVIDVSGGTGPYLYSINNGAFQSSNVFTNVGVGTSFIRLKDSNNCEPVRLTAEIANPITANISITKTLDCTSGAEVTVAATGGFSPYAYSIDNGTTFQSSNIFTNLNAGNYSVIVKDINNTFATSNVITVLPVNAPTITVSKTNTTCYQANDGSINIQVQGGKAPYSYSINNSAFVSTNVFTNLSAGVYNVTVKDANGCLSSYFIQIDQPSPITLIANVSNSTNGNNGKITVVATGGVASYTYALTNNGMPASVFQTSTIFDGLQVGSYDVQVRDANGCIAIRTVSIVDGPPALLATATATPITCTNPYGIITANATGGTPPYTYSFDNGMTYSASNTYTAFPGTYLIKVKDATNTETSTTINLIVPPSIATTATLIKAIDCTSNATVIINAVGGIGAYQYSINGSVYSSNNIFTDLGAGTYQFSVKDSGSCVSLTNTLVIEPLVPLTATATNTVFCRSEYGSVTITASGGRAPYQYSLKDDVYTTTNTFNEVGSGIYTIKVKDANDCIFTLPYTITEPANMIGRLVVEGNTASIVNVRGGSGTYLYSLNDGELQSSNVFTNLRGSNWILVYDSLGCFGFAHSFFIEDPIALTVQINKAMDCSTNTGTISVVASGGKAPYEYSINGGTTYQTNAVFNNLPAGTYTVWVKDAAGTINSENTVDLMESAPVFATATITKATSCNENDIVTINATQGKAPYLYSANGITFSSVNTFNELTAGTHNLYVKDSNGCQVIVSVTIESSSAVTATTTQVTPYCFNNSNGSITVIANGGKAPYTYSIDNKIYTSANIFTGLTAGQYIIWVKDALGCGVALTVELAQPTILSLTNTATNSTTVASNDGKITISAQGGTAPYQYVLKYDNISIPQTSPIFEGLSVGKYNIEVIDSRGCSVNLSGITITSQTLFGTLMIKPITCTTLGTITINAAGGKYPHQYSFDNGITYGSSNIASNLQAGDYTIKVKDAGGDILTLSTALAGVNSVVATASITSPIRCPGNNDAVIQVTASGGKAPYLYSLNGNTYQASNIFSNLYAGTYLIAVKDSNECTSTLIITVTESIALIATAEVVNQNVTINATGGAGGYRYAISPNLNLFSTNNTFSNLSTGIYRVVTSDLNGCYVMSDITVDPVAPTIDGQSNKITVEFKAGQTLADLTIDGQDIKWYSTPGTSPTSKTNETPLPLTTVLVDGKTYYASQTINGIESKERLAVTAKVNGSLSAPDFNLTSFQFYPNPVIDILNIENNAVIDDVEIIDVSGKSVLSKKINALSAGIDLSSLSSGVYILKVTSEGKAKTVKFIKK
ncbi:T9SS type A sorting domain-containing protein [Flavobacterium sp. KACC 22761]|uniref:T9SS type A sorting domain-containing protein n=1 Tax=Flavobacterium sp. KACC 22761 TaxID=3092665 RepID=UPI002A752B23|nr:T9SS type A sorting domain-containing protein [Flavobacterium sp. KACC 22761]WPO80338.1 T9SS type A sorting domain-containing protein [Flavobacterium sp. KACC 22761]